MYIGKKDNANDFATQADLEAVKRSGIKRATIVGGSPVYINNYTLSNNPNLLLEDNVFVWSAASTNIIRVDNIPAGYLLFNSNDKRFYLKKVETDLNNEPKHMYFISVLWTTGVYSENGVLKLPPTEIPVQGYIATLTSNSTSREEYRREFFTYGKLGMLKLDIVWNGTGTSGSIATLPNNAPTFKGLVEVQSSGDSTFYISGGSRTVMAQGMVKGKRYIVNLVGFLN